MCYATGGGWSSKVSDPQLIAGCLRTSPQKGLPDRLAFSSNLIGQVNNASAQLFEGNFNASSSPGNYSFSFESNMYRLRASTSTVSSTRYRKVASRQRLYKQH